MGLVRFCDYRNSTRNYGVFAAYILEPGGHWTMNMKRNAAGVCIGPESRL
jgi:hypothetical protein